MKIGFIGLGHMGAAIADNILQAGHELTVWNRSPEPAARLAQKGAHVASTPDQALQGDALFSILANDQAIRDVGLDDGLLDRAKPGLIHVNLATISVDFARALTRAHSARGLHYIAAPVLGRPDVAAKGELVVVRGGDADAIARLASVFDAFGKRLVIAGPEPWQANLFKLAANFCIASALETMGEAFALLRKGGVDIAGFHQVLANSLFTGPVYQNYGKQIVEEAYAPAGFNLLLGAKDVGLVNAAAKGEGVPMPFAALLSERFEEARKAGFADLEWSSIAKVAAQNAGL